MVYRVQETSFTLYFLNFGLKMPFEKRTVMEQKSEFVRLALKGNLSHSELCSRFGISRPTGYKWLKRFNEQGQSGLNEISRRPSFSPNITDQLTTDRLLELKKKNEVWGAKKIRRLYSNKYGKVVPSVTTVHNIFKRNGLVESKKCSAGQTWQRFEHDYPNELWQMDFKGDFAMSNKKRCYPLTIEDDHSRFNICLQACKNQQGSTVKSVLAKVFTKYGKPNRILADNGNPWGISGRSWINNVKRITEFEKWLIMHDVELIHGRPRHPQTQGKLERYHKTLKKELLSRNEFRNNKDCQRHFDQWRSRYNEERPHESINLDTPIEWYYPSENKYTSKPKEFEYDQDVSLRKVCAAGSIYYRGQRLKVGKGLSGEYVGIQSHSKSSFAIYFRWKMLAEIEYDSVKDVS